MTASHVVVKLARVGASETFILSHVAALDAVLHEMPPRPLLVRRIEGVLARGGLYVQGRDGLSAVIEENQPDAVLAEYGTTAVLSRRACRRAGVPLVAYFHAYEVTRSSVLRRYERGFRQLFRDGTFCIASSIDIRNRLLSLGCARERVEVVPCGARDEFFRVPATHVRPPIVLAVGRLTSKKNPVAVIDAFSEVRDSVPGARLDMIGDGPLAEACRRRIADRGLHGQVRMLGALPGQVVVDHMATARVFVQHSAVGSDGNTEGSPVAIAEAHAAGVPVVSTRHGGIPEIVMDGASGFLVQEGDVSGMADAMQRLLLNPELAMEMGLRGRHHVSSGFTAAATATALRRIMLTEAAKATSGA